MADDDRDFKYYYAPPKPKCKLCKKKERSPASNVLVKSIQDRLAAAAADSANLGRSDVEKLKNQQKHLSKIVAGDYCPSCVEKVDLWIV